VFLAEDRGALLVGINRHALTWSGRGVTGDAMRVMFATLLSLTLV
jgi:hypothetical protein